VTGKRPGQDTAAYKNKLVNNRNGGGLGRISELKHNVGNYISDYGLLIVLYTIRSGVSVLTFHEYYFCVVGRSAGTEINP